VERLFLLSFLCAILNYDGSCQVVCLDSRVICKKSGVEVAEKKEGAARLIGWGTRLGAEGRPLDSVYGGWLVLSVVAGLCYRCLLGSEIDSNER